MTQQSWTIPEECLLETLRCQGWSYDRIAKHMDRTVDSVRNKIYKMTRNRDGKRICARNRGAAIRNADSMALADELIARGWKCYAPKRQIARK